MDTMFRKNVLLQMLIKPCKLKLAQHIILNDFNEGGTMRKKWNKHILLVSSLKVQLYLWFSCSPLQGNLFAPLFCPTHVWVVEFAFVWLCYPVEQHRITHWVRPIWISCRRSFVPLVPIVFVSLWRCLVPMYIITGLLYKLALLV